MLIKLFYFKRKRKGENEVLHMHNTNDGILINYRPDSLQEDNYIVDIEAIIENGAYHSDKVLETDDERRRKKLVDIFSRKIK